MFKLTFEIVISITKLEKNAVHTLESIRTDERD